MKEVDPASPYLKDEETWYRYLTRHAREVFHNRSNDADIFAWAEQYKIPQRYIDEILCD